MKMKQYKIYLDTCCLNRPFDDLSSDRVRLEADAVLSILSHCKNGEWWLLNSDVIKRELSRQTDIRRLEKVEELLSIAKGELKTSAESIKMAEKFQEIGIKVFDSYHLAVASINKCDVFLTTDDKFLRKAKTQNLSMTVENPAIWVLGGDLNE